MHFHLRLAVSHGQLDLMRHSDNALALEMAIPVQEQRERRSLQQDADANAGRYVCES